MKTCSFSHELYMVQTSLARQTRHEQTQMLLLTKALFPSSGLGNTTVGNSGSGCICFTTGMSSGRLNISKALTTASPPTPCMGENVNFKSVLRFSDDLDRGKAINLSCIFPKHLHCIITTYLSHNPAKFSPGVIPTSIPSLQCCTLRSWRA